ncbi:MAG: DUF4271 domain-containing protein [Bacteroidales bacterium]|jgi:hypothetical protein|nr:DUF4271 domain-containing protein [Bacteroidales bacterium]
MLTDSTATVILETSVSSIQSSDDAFATPFLELAEKVDVETFERISMFDGHLLKIINTEGLSMPNPYSAWFFALLFFSFVLFAWLMSFNIKRVGRLLGALFGNRGFSRLTRDGDVFSEQLFFPIIILMLLCFSLFVFRVGMILGFWTMLEPETIAIYGQVMVGVGLLYLVKVIFIKISAWVFKEQTAATQYLLNLFVFNTSLTLLFLPLLLMAFFGDSWLQTSAVYTMIFLFAVWFIWRGVRSFSVTMSLTKFSYVHNFLYLCTFEIGYYLLVCVILNRILML